MKQTALRCNRQLNYTLSIWQIKKVSHFEHLLFEYIGQFQRLFNCAIRLINSLAAAHLPLFSKLCLGKSDGIMSNLTRDIGPRFTIADSKLKP